VSDEIQKLVEKLHGRFLVFDGVDGCGKSTQAQRLFETLAASGAACVPCCDPSRTGVAGRIRSVLLDHDLAEMDIHCETLLFMAARAQLMAEVIRPAMEEGKMVVCDRFVTATCAYQGAAGYEPKRVIELARFAIGDRWPDVTLILDIEVETGFDRIARRAHHAGKPPQRGAGKGLLSEGNRPDAMEARPLEFHRRVRQIFQELHEYYPTPVLSVDAHADADTVHSRVVEELLRVPL
jgi:dTMP kinase